VDFNLRRPRDGRLDWVTAASPEGDDALMSHRRQGRRGLPVLFLEQGPHLPADELLHFFHALLLVFHALQEVEDDLDAGQVDPELPGQVQNGLEPLDVPPGVHARVARRPLR